MASPAPLQGIELIDCVKANVSEEIKVVSQLCGYGEDIEAFESELKKAGDYIGVEIKSFQDFKEHESKNIKERKIEIAPETKTQL